MRALFLPAFGPEGASSRFRVYQFVAPLRASGWTVAVLGPARASRRSRAAHLVRACLGARAADVVVLQKRLMGRTVRVLGRVNPRLVYDLDDAIWAAPPSVRVPEPALERVRVNLRLTVASARAVTAGNSYLADRLAGLNPRVVIVPTTIDTDVFRPDARGPRGADTVVGWIGNPENLGYLEALNPVFARLSARLPGRFVLRVVSSRPPRRPPPCPWEFRGWSVAEEVGALQRFDVGIMPLPDDEWTRGKCGFKAIAYMSVGAAAVVSPVGVNREIVTHGRNGMWARTEEEWLDVLGALVVQPDLRRRLAAEARDTVVGRYSTRSALPTLAAVLTDVAGGRRARPGERRGPAVSPP